MPTSPASSHYTPLARRPQATTVTVKELIAKVRAGEVRIPSFQRPLRWKVADVEKLLDSIWRGYPVGSLLFWKREAAAEEIQVGSARIPAPKVRDAWWVVDGQQRTTALAASLLDLDHGGDRRWGLFFDPEAQVFVAKSPEDSEHCVPVSVLGDLRRLGRWIRDHDLENELVDRLEEAQQRLLDYAIPAYVVDTDDEQALRAVFARLNSSGARMRADEVFQALLGEASKTGSSLDLDALQQACDRNDFGAPPRADVLKAVLSMSGMEPTSRPQDLKPVDLEALVSYEAAEGALTRTIEFLQERCGIPHVRLIPYPVVLSILARWFHVHRDSEPATLARLAQWVWRGAASGAHQRAEVSRMRLQVRVIEGDDDEASLDRLIAHVGARPDPAWELKPFDQRSARSRIEVLALLAARPTDPLGPVSLHALTSGERLAREVVEWRVATELRSPLVRTAANRVLLDAHHTGLSRELKEWDPQKNADALRSHLIEPSAFQALLDDDFEAFLRIRGETLADHVARYLERQAGWDGPVIRPRRSYSDASVSQVGGVVEAE